MTFEEFWKTNGVTSNHYPLVAETYKEVAKNAWDACKQEALKTLLLHKTIAYPSYCGSIGWPYIKETAMGEIEKL